LLTLKKYIYLRIIECIKIKYNTLISSLFRLLYFIRNGVKYNNNWDYEITADPPSNGLRLLLKNIVYIRFRIRYRLWKPYVEYEHVLYIYHFDDGKKNPRCSCGWIKWISYMAQYYILLFLYIWVLAYDVSN